MVKSNCFFSYASEEDTQKAAVTEFLLSSLKKKIEELSYGEVDVFYDRSANLEGRNWEKLEMQIKDSNCVLIFFTPEYKKKVEAEIDSGVYREYSLIKDRAKAEDASVIPILLSGSVENAVTAEFKKIVCWDFTRVKYQFGFTHGHYEMYHELSEKVLRLAKRSINKAKTGSYLKKYQFSSPQAEYKSLFLDTSAGALPPECIIKTEAHEKIINQEAYFIIGRKGSGKSTLLTSIRELDPKYYEQNYKELLSMAAESIDINFIYSELITRVSREFDVISMTKILDVLWEMIFILQGMLIISRELENYTIEETDSRYEVFADIAKKLKSLLGNAHIPYSVDLPADAICHCAVEILTDHIKKDILNNASVVTPLTGAYSSINSMKILGTVFGEQSLRGFCLAIKKCNKNILIALDSFDTHSEDFRKTTNLLSKTNQEEYTFRKDFEIRLFRELLVTISKIKGSRAYDLKTCYFSKVHFCVILPQDRYDEIALDDRDIAKKSFCNLNWDAYELLEMLVKRLEFFYCKNQKQTGTLEDRFYNIIRTNMPNVPTVMSIDIQDTRYQIPLFSYLLRYTFWRPRDIIMNFALVMKLGQISEDLTEENQSIIKRSLVVGAKKIIENEFINEYKNVYLNISEVLQKFHSSDILLEYKDFTERLSKIQIQSVTGEDFSTTDSKLKLFYKLGIVGLYFETLDITNYGYGNRVCYCFNEGLAPIDDLLNHTIESKQAKIIFNPIFEHYLSLNFNTKELVGNFSWQYIMENHVLKDTIRRI